MRDLFGRFTTPLEPSKPFELPRSDVAMVKVHDFIGPIDLRETRYCAPGKAEHHNYLHAKKGRALPVGLLHSEFYQTRDPIVNGLAAMAPLSTAREWRIVK